MPESEGQLRISIDREICMGSGVCVVYAASTFTQDAESKAVLVDLISDSVEQIQTAVEACPTGALSVQIDDAGV
jgi:ferredoxin